MKRAFLIPLVIVLAAVIAAAFLVSHSNYSPQSETVPRAPTSTIATPSSSMSGFDQSLSDGTITISYPSADFGLATDAGQVLIHPEVPPCDMGFAYCLYYDGLSYQGTNFESAGIWIGRRTDLTTDTACITTEPDGYNGIVPVIATSSDYMASAFKPLENGDAGHSVIDAIYRLAYQGSCYEFDARVSQSDFGAYPPGSIQEFTSTQETGLETELQSVLGTLTLASGEKVSFPGE